MATPFWRGFGIVTLSLLLAGAATPAHADEIWVAPTSQADIGGLGVGSNGFWPVTPIGAARFGWSIPDDLQTFQSAKIVLIPGSTGGGATLNLFVCAAQSGTLVAANCAGPFSQAFARTANQLVEVDITGMLASRVLPAGSNYLAVLAYTTPTTTTDHFAGLRFNYGGQTIAGSSNTAVGFNALRLHDSGEQNSALGASALESNTTGSFNTAVGSIALKSNTTGSANTGTGQFALSSTTSGNSNTATGAAALGFNTTGGANTAVGASALRNHLTGDGNTAIGASALQNNATGSNNVALGLAAGVNATTGSNNIYLGASVAGVAGDSNTMYLGKVGTQTTTFIAGVRGITTVNADAIPVVIDSAGQLGTISSSIRFKEDIRDMTDVSQRLFNLRPVTFRYTKPFANGSKPIQFGLVAEEVAEAFPELAVRDANGNVETVHYETLNVLLLNEVQRQQRQLAQERTLREDEQKRIDVLEQRLNELLRERATAQP